MNYNVKKIILISAIIIGMIVVVILLVNYYLNLNKTTITNDDGYQLKMNNVFNDQPVGSSSIEQNENGRLLYVTHEKAKLYFSKSDNYFLLDLTSFSSQELSSQRVDIEKEIKNYLGINDTDACKLQLQVNLPDNKTDYLECHNDDSQADDGL